MHTELRPRITVVGVGGAGGNAVNNMIRAKLEGVEFIIANTDAQALTQSLVTEDRRLQLGLQVTQGLGAGSKPDVGRSAAEESMEEIAGLLRGSNMVFITAGMGGGTGTGAAPVIARAARESGILTVGVVTKPFHFEGSHRSRTAERGIEELQQYVDTLIIIPNQNLFRIANERTTFADAFKMADDVLYSGVRGVTDLMIMPGLINLDFADIRAVMAEMGKAMMGTGEAQGERRALDAAEAAISNPLLDDVSMNGARGVLINITGGFDMTLYEVDEAANRIRDEVDPEANIIFGSTFDEKLNGTIRVSVVATGIGEIKEKMSMSQQPQAPATPSSHPSMAPNFNNREYVYPTTSGFTPPRAAPQPIDITGTSTAYQPTPPSFMAAPEAISHAQQSQPEFVHPHQDGVLENTASTTAHSREYQAAGYMDSPEQELNNVEDFDARPTVAPAVAPAPVKAPGLQAQQMERPEERKRPASLFERFTGVTRGKSNTPEPKSTVSVISTSEKNSEEENEILDIPAFLRREG